MLEFYGFIRQVHAIFGREVLALLIVAAAIYLTVTYKPDAPRGTVARVFPILVDLQVGLGILLYIVSLIIFNGTPYGASLLGFPFILHPVLGILAAGLAHMAVGARNPLRSLGRYAPLASLAILLVLVISNTFTARLT
jgi:hypothetical protein